MNNYSFTSFIDKYTRITNESATCIDHNFVRFKHSQNFKSGVFHLNITDHSIISFIMNFEKTSHCNSVSQETFETFN